MKTFSTAFLQPMVCQAGLQLLLMISTGLILLLPRIAFGETPIESAYASAFPSAAPMLVCDGAGTTWSAVSEPLPGFAQQAFYFQGTATDTLGLADIVLVAQGGNNSNHLASDLLMAIIDPRGNGVQWGGNNMTTFNLGLTDLADWPASWQDGAEIGSPWSTSVDLSAGHLYGTGVWTVLLAQGTDAANADMVYDVQLTMPEMCATGGGCTDADACNYDATAILDDGTCAYNPFGDCTCNSAVTTTETLAGGMSGTAVSFNGSGTMRNVCVELAFTGNGEAWPSDLMLSLTSPMGECLEVGGLGVTNGCAQTLSWTSWPSDWRHPFSSDYSATLDLSGTGLSGDGDWTVQLVNGDGSAAAVTYDATLTFYGICPGGVISGCTDAAACNYDDLATVDDGGCAEIDACGDCGGDNGNCSGCTYEFACNYDPDALYDDGSCNIVEDLVVGCCSFTQVLGEALSGNQSTTWQVPASSIGGLGVFDISLDFQATGSMKNWVSDLQVSFIDPNGLCLFFGGNEKTDGATGPYMSANNCTEVPGSGWPEEWDTNVAGTYTAQIDLTATALDGIGDWTIGLHNGDLNTSPAEYSALVWNVDGLCNVEGCTDTLACNYTPNFSVANDSLCVFATGCESCNADGTLEANDDDGDGICNDADLCSDTSASNYADPANTACTSAGCTNPCASNYDAAAEVDDGSCLPVPGCMDAAACNYDACADEDTGCQYLDACGVCGGSGLDIDGDGVCDSDEILGCTYPGACNLDTLATQDDGSCTFPDCGYGCDGLCLEDQDNDGVCDEFEVRGCMEPEADNYHPAATDDDGTCYFNPCIDTCPADVNEDGLVGVLDVLFVLSYYDSFCP